MVFLSQLPVDPTDFVIVYDFLNFPLPKFYYI